MPDLETQLRRYCSLLDDGGLPWEADARAQTSPRGRHRVAAMATAAAVAAIVVGLVPLALGLWNKGNAGSVDPAHEDRTIEIEAASSAVLDGWTRRDFPGLGGLGEVADLTASGSTVVVVGLREVPCVLASGPAEREQPCVPVAWVSADRGASWRVMEIGEPGDDVLGVTTGPTGFVAVGTRDVTGESPQGIVWTSADGHSWVRRTPGQMDGSFVTGVASGAGGLAAAGFCVEEERCRVAVWRSSDGVTWSDPQVFEEETLQVVTIDAHGPGFVIAALVDSSTPPNPRPTLWVGGNETWAEIDPGVSGYEATRLAGGPGGIFIASRPTMVRSDDGTSWEPSAFSGCIASGFSDVTAADGFVAIGRCRDTQMPGVWSSPDGLLWDLITSDDPFFSGEMSEIHADPEGVIVLGGTTVWIGPPSGP